MIEDLLLKLCHVLNKNTGEEYLFVNSSVLILFSTEEEDI